MNNMKYLFYNLLLITYIDASIIVIENDIYNHTVNLFNNARYRESINTKYALKLKSNSYKMNNLYKINTTASYKMYEGDIHYGKYQLRDYNITQKWTTIDEINIYLPVHQLVYILAQITMINNHNDFYVKITDNGHIIYDDFYAYANHFDTYPLLEGYHKLELHMMSTYNNINLRPSKGGGFEHSYQFACWSNNNNENKSTSNYDNVNAINNVIMIGINHLRSIFM
jgi:hypothetical protein